MRGRRKLWKHTPANDKRGAQAVGYNRRTLEFLADQGRLGREIDLHPIATSGATTIWHTESVAACHPPQDTPVDDASLLHRGFPVDQLGQVLTTGIDVPDRTPFYAADLGKAWEFPSSPRSIAAVLVLDRSHTRRSFVPQPPEAEPSWTPGPDYPHRYHGGDTAVFTRFDPSNEHSPSSYLDEAQYGHWVPGSARKALLHVYLGGSRRTILTILRGLSLPDQFQISYLS